MITYTTVWRPLKYRNTSDQISIINNCNNERKQNATQARKKIQKIKAEF